MNADRKTIFQLNALTLQLISGIPWTRYRQTRRHGCSRPQPRLRPGRPGSQAGAEVSATRRVKIAKDGTVKHKGRPTRWYVEWNSEGGCWTLYLQPEPYSRHAELWF